MDWNYSKRIEALNLNNPKYDVLVFGNSLAMDGIDTKYLTDNGFAAYNTAIGGTSLKTNLIQLQEYLTMYEHKPKIILLGLSSYLNTFDFDSDTINPIVDFTTATKKIYRIDDIPILKFKWMFKEMLKKLVSKSHRDAYLINGQLRFGKTVSDNSKINNKNSFPLEDYMSSDFLKSFINICNSNDIKLIIFEMPGFKKTRHPKSHNCFVIDKLNNNGFLYDFNSYQFGKNFDDNEDWIGKSHLNEKGARKFTQYIIKLLDEIGTDSQQCI